MYISPARVSYMYYEQNMTQQQIAKRLGIPRMKVSRLLQQARQEGIVKTTIRYDGFFPDLEDSLQKKFPSIDFIISEALDGNDDSIKKSIGSTAAGYLEQNVHPHDCIAVGWGTTLLQVAEHLRSLPEKVTIAPLIGGQAGTGLDVHAASIAEVMAENTGSTALRIFAPAVAESKEAKDLLVSTDAVRKTLAAAAAAEVLVFSLGTPFSELNTIEKIGYYSQADIEDLRRQRAICDVISLAYYNAELTRVCIKLSSLTISIDIDQLKAIPKKICVAGGTDKHSSIEVALRLKLIDVLVTDEITARFLLGF